MSDKRSTHDDERTRSKRLRQHEHVAGHCILGHDEATNVHDGGADAADDWPRIEHTLSAAHGRVGVASSVRVACTNGGDTVECE